MHESCMLAVGSVKSLIIDKASKGKLAFDVQSFLTTVVLNDLKSGGRASLLINIDINISINK